MFKTDKWEYISDSTVGLYWQSHYKYFSMNGERDLIEIYNEKDSAIWELLIPRESIFLLYLTMFPEAKIKFSSYQEGKDMADLFLSKLEKLRAFI